MIDVRTLAAAEAYTKRVEVLVEKLCRLHRLSESEAIEFIERFNVAPRETERKETP